MTEPEPPGDAAEEIRRLRAQIRNIVAAVVVLAILGLMVYGVTEAKRDAKTSADELIECLRSATTTPGGC